MESIGLPVLTVSIFCVCVIALLILDITSHDNSKPVSIRAAVIWSFLYIVCALLFALYIYYEHGSKSASLFLTGYTLEKTLAFDNLFIFSMIFTYFGIPPERQHAALHWGIIGAIFFRLVFVFLGVTSIGLFGPVMELLFAVMIVVSIILIIQATDEEPHFDNVWYVKALRKRFPKITLFMLAICAIEISDIMFSFDSVPAVIAITQDPFLIYSAMIFAILGLRSMYFVIEAMSRYLLYMDNAIIVVLSFIALKLIVHSFTGLSIDPNISLLIVLAIMGTGIVLSLLTMRRLKCSGIS